MTKSFFAGLMLIFFMLGFVSCKSVPYKKNRHFIASTAEGLVLDYTEKCEDGSFTEKVIMNKITYGNEIFPINKDCSWEKSGVIFPEGGYVISGKTVNNLKWENGNAWVVNCYDSEESKILFGNDTLARVYFGWCNCDIENKAERIFVVNVVKYLGTEAGGIGGECYIAILREIL